jgi:hypoxanthine phosphoribosyltransferase
MSSQMSTGNVKEFISSGLIRSRVDELGELLTAEYAGIDEITVVCVLKGAFIFTADLVRRIGIPCHIEFIAASSYGSRRSSSGTVCVDRHTTFDIEGRHVLLLEDIVDTGLTLSAVTAELLLRNPASLKTCCLLDKPSARSVPVTVDHAAFTIPDLFVVGYGLDAAGRFRELPFIGLPEL